MDRGTAELWTFPITEEAVAKALPLLDSQEHERAGRFLADAPRSAFVATRGALRQLCGYYLDTDPKRLEFAVNEHGKPYLPDSQLEFNVSHSGKIAALAFAWQQPIGIDVERTGRNGDIRRIASRFFHREEAAAIEAAPDPVQAFYRCWTSKEAYVKAVGQGLSLGLDTFRVAVEGEPGVLSDPSWRLHTWPPAPGYTATAAVQGPATFLHRAEPFR
jgi:4'-phosphopantetheinyl transferase